MNTRRFCGWFVAVALVAIVANPALAARLVSVSSRLEHGRQSFDVALPLDQSGIEPRNLRSGMTLVLKFDRAVDALDVSVTEGKARAGRPVIEGNVVTIALTGVRNGEQVQLSIAGKEVDAQQISFRALRGDVNGDAIVNDADAKAVEHFIGKAVTAATARYDVAASGTIDTTDTRRVRSELGQHVEGEAVRNTPPTISTIPDQKSVVGRIPPGIGFQIHDAETPPEQLMVWAASESRDILPDKNIEISGDGALRVLTAQPAAGQTGDVKIKVTVLTGRRTPRPFSVTSSRVSRSCSSRK